MSDYLEQMERERADAAARIRTVKIDLKAQQDMTYEQRRDWTPESDLPTPVPRHIVWARSAYELHVDGVMRGYLTCEGAYRNTHWRIYINTGKSPYHGNWAVRGRTPDKLSDWLARYYKPEDYPSKAEIAEQACEAARREQEARDRRAAEREQRRELAQVALNGLREIDAMDLTNFQRSALAYAMKHIEGIAK